MRRLAWLQHLWQAPRPDPGWGWTLNSPDTQAAERDWRRSDSAAEGFSAALEAADAALAGPAGAPRRRLWEIYGLAEAECDLLDVTSALALEPDIQPILAAIDPSSQGSAVREACALRLFDSRQASVWRPAGPLARWQLVHEIEGPQGSLFRADGFAIRTLQGVLTLDRALQGWARIVEPRFNLPSWPIERVVRASRALIQRRVPVRISIRARPDDGALDCAAELARRLGVSALYVKPPPAATRETAQLAARLTERIALTGGYAVVGPAEFFAACGELGGEGSPLHIALIEGQHAAPPGDGRAELWVELEQPTPEDLETIWHENSQPESEAAPLSSVVRHRGARAEDVLAVAKIGLAHRDAATKTLHTRVRSRIGDIGRLAPKPYVWSDLVLDERTRAQLEQIAFEASTRLRSNSHERLGSGMSILLHGPPGTGKTMAAQVLAREIGIELLNVDAASLVSKWVGETAKALRRLFSAVSGAEALLFFDEADSIYSRRTNVQSHQDVHNNTDTSYLLQLMDSFDGVSILATNNKTNMDPAFFRRIRHVVEFRMPSEAQRLDMWELSLEQLRAADSAVPDRGLLEQLADAIDFSPAQIRSAATTAHFHALREGSPLGVDALLKGVEEELAKEGRRTEKLRARLEMHHG